MAKRTSAIKNKKPSQIQVVKAQVNHNRKGNIVSVVPAHKANVKMEAKPIKVKSAGTQIVHLWKHHNSVTPTAKTIYTPVLPSPRYGEGKEFGVVKYKSQWVEVYRNMGESAWQSESYYRSVVSPRVKELYLATLAEKDSATK